MEIARVYHWGNESKSLTQLSSRRRNKCYCRPVAAYIMSDNQMQTKDVCQGLELAQSTMLDISESDKLENWTAVGVNH